MRIGIIALTVLLAVALSACGGSGTSEPSSTAVAGAEDGSTFEDQAAIRDTLEALAKEPDPGLCTEAITENWLEDSFPPAGEGALEECRQSQRPGTKILAEEIRLEDVEIDGNEATATFEEIGPEVGGIEGRIRLLQDGAGVWRVDEVISMRITDRPQYLRAARAAVLHGPGAATEKQADCMVGQIDRMSNGAIERRAVANETPLRIYEKCLGGSARAAVLTMISHYLDDSARFSHHAGCAVRLLGRVLNETQAREYLEQEDRDTVRALLGRALASCGAVTPLDGERSLT